VVAELVPPAATRAPPVPDALLADAVRRGVVTPAALPPGAPPGAAWRRSQRSQQLAGAGPAVIYIATAWLEP
jgi:hypothetical protein